MIRRDDTIFPYWKYGSNQPSFLHEEESVMKEIHSVKSSLLLGNACLFLSAVGHGGGEQPQLCTRALPLLATEDQAVMSCGERAQCPSPLLVLFVLMLEICLVTYCFLGFVLIKAKECSESTT